MRGFFLSCVNYVWTSTENNVDNEQQVEKNEMSKGISTNIFIISPFFQFLHISKNSKCLHFDCIISVLFLTLQF